MNVWGLPFQQLSYKEGRPRGRWRGQVLIVSIALVLAPSLYANNQDLTPARQAEAAWAARDQAGRTEEAIALWKKALQSNPDSPDLLIPLTKACGRAVRHANSKKGRLKWADLAKEYGSKAVALSPNNPEALTIYGEALGQWARYHKLHGLGTVRQAVEVLKKAVEIKPDQAFAHMLLAEIYMHAPGMISVGDKKKGLEHAKMGASLPGAYAINYLVLARIYLERGDKEAARKQLDTILKLTPPPDAIPETRADQETAREMLEKI